MNIEELVILAKNGDKTAEEEIIKGLALLIIKYSRRVYICGLDENDFKQMGFLTVIKAIKSYNPVKSDSFLKFVCCSLKNNYNNEVRRKYKYKFETSLNKLIDENVEFEEFLVSDINIEEEFLYRESLRHVFRLVNKLSFEERELVNYVYVKGYSLRDYTRLKNIKYFTAAKRKERMLDKIRNMLSMEKY